MSENCNSESPSKKRTINWYLVFNSEEQEILDKAYEKRDDKGLRPSSWAREVLLSSAKRTINRKKKK